jgi:translation initiation factor IF-3
MTLDSSTQIFFVEFGKVRAIASTDYRINREIRAREVRLIVEEEGKEGESAARDMGVVTLERALEIAEENTLDLVEVAPNATPPDCRVMDYGKFMYERQRKERKARKNQVKIEIKEIQLKPKTDDYHIGFKLKQAREWLEEGMKVRVRVRFRGREITHSHLGRTTLEEIKTLLADIGQVEQMPNMEGRDMIMIIAPIEKK